MSVTLKGLAAAAGVSEATASLAMNERPGVNAATRANIQALAKQLGYIPCKNARSLAKKRSGLIGMIVPNISNANYSSLVQLAENSLLEKGYQMILATSRSDASYERDMIEQFISFRTEGVIIYPSIRHNPDPSYLNLLWENQTPFTYLGGYYRSVDAPISMVDYFSSIATAMRYLIGHGCRRPCLVSGCRTLVSNTLRFQGIADTMTTIGVGFSSEDHYELSPTNYDAAFQLANELLEGGGFPYDSIIAVNSETAMAFYNAILSHGLRVPEDVSIVSCDATLRPEVARVQLTSIRQNNPRMIQEALRLLFEQIKAPGTPYSKVVVPTDFVVGKTTRP